MNVEQSDLERRAQKHAALADPTRLAVVDMLTLSDRSPTELRLALDLSSNLLAHHLRVLEDAGLVERRRSEGDARRSYLSLRAHGFDHLVPSRGAGVPGVPGLTGKSRIVFVCTANSARSQLATALWRQQSDRPVASAGTHPAARIASGAAAAAKRHGLRLEQVAPQHLDDVLRDKDLVITVCDNAHEELAGLDAVHWSIPDPVPTNTAAAFDRTLTELDRRITALAN